MFGKLTLQALPHEPIVIAATIFMVCGVLFVFGLLTHYKKWTWLWKEWLTSVDHKKIGVMYIIVSLLMMLRGMVDATMLRTQQAVSVGASNGFLPPDHFDQLFSAHGVIMIFFVVMPFMFGLINCIIPLQIGARDVAFPFLNSLSFWLFASAAILMNISLFVGEFSSAGWLAYPPLSGLAYSPGVGIDYYIWILQISGVGTLLSGINFLVTILTMRCSGMTLMRMPVFVWTVLGSMILVISSFPILTATLGMLSLDRLLGMHFFTSDFGGNPMMYINLIWTWGHPEIYILILPAFGIFSEVVSNFSQKRLFGYTSMVLATLSITVLSFLVWLHHFFTMGAGANVNAFFGIMTMVIAIPTGVKIFNWIFTMFRGRIIFKSPMLWFLGFVATFTLGGVAGVLMAIPGIDFQLHNSLFLVAHFHTMIIGGVLFGYFAGLTYWFPKIFGFRLNERFGKYAFYCWIGGFFTVFVPLYILGMMGATRRLVHYEDGLGWQPLFIIAALGLGIILIGILFQIVQMILSIKNRKHNKDITGDAWNGRTLEWSIPSPAPFYNFAVLPKVYGRDAFWARKHSLDGVIHKGAVYQNIEIPKNTPLGMYIGIGAFFFGFGIVWHMLWLTILSVIGIGACIITRCLDDDTEYEIHAKDLERLEQKFHHT
jgi:cytochrome o ubiquinol oxidase subunit I